MADDGDRAQGLAEFHRTLALQRQNRKIQIGESLFNCADCEEEIPKKRREAVPGCKRCAFCQGQSESGV